MRLLLPMPLLLLVPLPSRDAIVTSVLGHKWTRRQELQDLPRTTALGSDKDGGEEPT